MKRRESGSTALATFSPVVATGRTRVGRKGRCGACVDESRRGPTCMELPSRNDERGIPHKPYVRRNPNQRRPRLVRRVCRVTFQCGPANLILADVSRLDQNLGMAGTGRAPVANTSLLMDRALALQRRADALLVRAKHPF